MINEKFNQKKKTTKATSETAATWLKLLKYTKIICIQQLILKIDIKKMF
jgi:hypothetical protein